MVRKLAYVLAIWMGSGSLPALATTYGWLGTADNTWSNSNNWSPVGTPNAPDAIATFSSVTAPLSVNVDTNITLSTLQLLSRPWALSGSLLGLAAPSALVQVKSGSAASYSGGMYANGSLTFDIETGSSFTSPPGGTVSTFGPGTLTKTGGGSLTLDYMGLQGNLTVAAGSMTIATQALPPGGLRSDLALDGALTCSGGCSWGALTGSGSLNSNYDAGFKSDTDSIFSGNITAATHLSKDGAGTLQLTGGNLWGETYISGGTLWIGNGTMWNWGGSGAITNNGTLVLNTTGNPILPTVFGSGSIVIKSGNVEAPLLTHSGSTTIESGANLTTDMMNVTGGVVVAAGGSWTATGNHTVGSIGGAGNFALMGIIYIGTPGGDSTFDGTLNAGPSATLYKKGGGTLTFTGHVTFPNTTWVQQGTLRIQGAVFSGGIYVESPGAFSGSGSVDNGLTLDPGTGFAPQDLNVHHFGGPANWTIAIEGTTPGTQYGRVITQGATAGASLALTGSYVPLAGDSFKVIDNQGGFAITGNFGGLPEGGVIPFNGHGLRATYVGGDGNDFVLSTATQVVTASMSGNGTMTPTGAQTFLYGETAAFTVTPAANYHTVMSGTCGGSLVGTTYTTNTITADCTVIASFAINQYTVGTSAGANGSLSPASQQVDHGAGTTVTVTPATGYHIDTVSGCGGSLSGNTYTITSLTGPCTVTAAFAINQYTVGTSAGANGSLSPASQQVNHGAGTTVTVTPATGYHIDTVSGCGGSLSGNTYTITNLTGPCTVTASFAINTYTVTPSAGLHGTISPSTPQTVNYNASAQFTVTPDAGYAATVGGTCGGFMGGNTFTTGAVTHDCTVSATFVALVVYNVVLEGWQQVGPYVVTPATGSGTATYDPVAHTLKLNLTYSGLGSAETGAHLHGPGARGANAAILVPLAANSPKTDEITLFPNEETMLANGELYVNIHTTNYPNGEIRGQIDNVGTVVRRQLTVAANTMGVGAAGSISGTTEAGAVIDCGTAGLGTDCSESIPDGKTVTLSATPSGGSTFVYWSGANCVGPANCVVTMDAAKTVGAHFDPPVTPDSADLALVQVATPNPAGQGKDIVFTLTVTNNGPGTAKNVSVVNQVPVVSDVVWFSPRCFTAQGTILVTCIVGDLAVGESMTFRVVRRPAAAGTFSNFAAAGGNGPDPVSLNSGGTLDVNVAATPPGTPILRYRLYSDVTKEHHFTTDLNEYNVLGTYVGTWVQEGTVGKILNNPGPFGGVESTPYYRLYDNSTRWHHWTTDPNEYYTLGYVYSGWNLEGVDGWILPSQAPGTTQLYRLNYPYLGSLHHWTIDANEYTTLINQYGWIGEPGAGFVVQ